MKRGANRSDRQLSEGTILSASRRHAHVLDDEQNVVRGTIASKAMDLSVGDRISFSREEGRVFVEEILPRKNCLARSYRRQVRRIAANLDRLFIVTAVQPGLNTIFVDRVGVAAELQHIPCTLILNKIDLEWKESKSTLDVYKKLGFEILQTSAKFGQGMEELRQRLEDPALSIVALCGVSGVGKSTILNKLVPEADRRTNELSEKSGQGKQTTTQSMAFPMERRSGPSLLLIDLPGLQSFGFSDVDKSQISEAFHEIALLKRGCEYSNCTHTVEPSCAVRQAVEDGSFARFRYESYRGIIDEIEENREY